MSTAEASLILYTAYGITVGIILAFILRQKREEAGNVFRRGVDVSAFRLKDVLFVGLLIFFYLLLVSGAVEAAQHKAQSPAREIPFPTPFFLFSSYIPLMAVAVAVVFRLRQPYLKAIPGWTGHATLQNLLLYPVLGLGICYGFYFLLLKSGLDECFRSLFSITSSQNVVIYLQEGTLPLKFSIAFISIILAPLIEEHVFRGYMYPVLKKYTGMIPAALFTSLLFGCVHASGAALIVLSFMSLILIFLFEKTKTIWAPVAMHAAFNAITVICVFYNYLTFNP